MNKPPFYQRYARRTCAVCGGMASNLLFRQTFSEMSSGSLLQGYDVCVCANCGFGFADRIPHQTEFDAHYRDMSKYEYQEQNGREIEHDLIRFRAMCDTIIPFLPGPNARLLDVGCATGRLLALFKEKGYDNVIGLDPSPVCAQVAQRLYGVRVLTGSVSDITTAMIAEHPLDCVILSGVLEHIQDVEQILRWIRGLLADDGLLFIEVPDATDFAGWPDAPFQEFSTEHINFFSALSLENLMRRYGFSKKLSHRIPRAQTYGTVMPVVTAIYRKETDIQPFLPVRDTDTERGLADYIRKSEEVENSIQLTIDSLVESASPIIVWGVGTHTLHLLTTSRLPQANIHRFVDSNLRYQGKQLNGIPIIAPTDLRGRPEAILISSRVFQPVIEKQIRDDLNLDNKIIKLYKF
ncbi:MAG: class I SAM-dependent methyltransferase [Kiritimatiellia bacterium]|jgi:2-polyprenyl-3-methyl-5-hydroxy-6-metoxy-1,4-benzoquinol methylase